MENKLSTKDFIKFKNLVSNELGIHLNDTKKDMVQSKVAKLMRQEQIETFDGYYSFLVSNRSKSAWQEFIDEITIHKTDFFRENNHFEFIKSNIEYIKKMNPRIMLNREIRAWSAGCSTGEEPYTLAIVLKQLLEENIRIKILATDVSKKSLETAQQGVYPGVVSKEIGKYFAGNFFKREESGQLRVIPSISNLVQYRLFNLMEPFPFKNKFDIIFCRNVMIYFDSTVQSELIKKFYNVLTPGGILLIGHSESLTGRQYLFKYLKPTIYVKER
jgi:chemotaxis protein methyltransferase CheR